MDPASPADGGRLHVLLVEDDPLLSDAIRLWIEKRGHHVVCCEQGSEALTVLEGGATPDVILLDLNMPRMDGWEFRLMQRRDPRWAAIPVIVMSGDHSAKAAAIDATAYLPKPVDEQDLIDAIERASRHVGHQRELARAAQHEQLISLGALLGGIAHEINNPLALILGNLDLLHRQLVRWIKPADRAERFEVATAMRALEHARAGTERIAAVVRSASMFAFADLASIESLDVHQVLESCLQIASNEIRHGAHLVRAYHDVPHVLGNCARLGQVFLNLLLNSLQAIRESGGHHHVIRVSTSLRDDWVVTTISDSATQLSPLQLGGLFTADETGSPLRFGLAVSREVVENWGGKLEATADPMGGTTFSVCLPPQDRASHPAPPPRPPTRMAREGFSVLVIDDEPLICELLSEMLSDEYTVATFSSPRAGLAALMEQDYDVILCDVMMPELNGIELFEHVVNERPALRDRFAFITGGAFTERARLLLKQIQRPVLRKPCTRAELLATVNDILVPAAD